MLAQSVPPGPLSDLCILERDIERWNAMRKGILLRWMAVLLLLIDENYPRAGIS